MITGEASVNPYPCTMGNPAPKNARATSSEMGALPETRMRIRPPIALSQFFENQQVGELVLQRQAHRAPALCSALSRAHCWPTSIDQLTTAAFSFPFAAAAVLNARENLS